MRVVVDFPIAERDDNGFEFQSFRFMDRHDANRILGVGRCYGFLYPLFVPPL